MGRAVFEKLFSPLVVGIGSRAISQLVAFSLVVVASRYLDLSGFGTFSLAWAATVVSVTFVFTGFYHAILRSKDLEREADSLFWSMQSVGVLASCIMVSIGLYGVTGDLSRALLWLSIIPAVIALVAWNEALLLSQQRARAASIHHAVSEIVAICVAILAFEAGLGVMGLVAGRLAATATGLTLTTAFVRRRPRVTFDFLCFNRSLRTAIPLWVSSAISLFGNYGSDFILGVFLSPAAVGAYRGGSRIASTATDLVSQPMGMLNWAKFSRLERSGNIPELKQAWYQHTAFSMALTWPVLISVAMLAPELILLLFGEDWLPTAPIVTLLAMAKAVGMFQFLLEPTLSCMDRGALQVKLRFAGAALLLALLLIAGPIGAEAVAVAHIAANAVMGFACIWAMSATLGIPIRQMLPAFAPGLGISAICAMGILFWRSQFSGLDAQTGLVLAIALLSITWVVTAGALIRTRILALPTP